MALLCRNTVARNHIENISPRYGTQKRNTPTSDRMHSMIINARATGCAASITGMNSHTAAPVVIGEPRAACNNDACRLATSLELCRNHNCGTSHSTIAIAANTADGLAQMIARVERSHTIERSGAAEPVSCSKSKPQSHRSASGGLNNPQRGHLRPISSPSRNTPLEFPKHDTDAHSGGSPSILA